MAKLVEVEGQRIGGQAQALGDLAGGKAFGAGLDEEAEDVEPGFLGEGGKGGYGVWFFHSSMVLEILNLSIVVWRERAVWVRKGTPHSAISEDSRFRGNAGWFAGWTGIRWVDGT